MNRPVELVGDRHPLIVDPQVAVDGRQELVRTHQAVAHVLAPRVSLGPTAGPKDTKNLGRVNDLGRTVSVVRESFSGTVPPCE